MVSQTILLYALFAGLVAILVTVAIEKFGGIIGGVLGTIPSTIIPAAAGVYSIDGTESLRDSMSMVPIGMLMNGIFLSVWIYFPKYIKQEKLKLISTTIFALVVWLALAIFSLKLVELPPIQDLGNFIIGLIGFVLLVIFSVLLNLNSIAAPKGENKVPMLILGCRGIAAALAIGFCLILAKQGLPLVAGLVSAFPAIFLTSMVALWLSQGSQVPRGAAAPMMLGGASVSVYALVSMYAIPEYGIVTGSILTWFSSVILWTIPAFLVLRKYKLTID